MSNKQLPASVQERIKADADKLYPLFLQADTKAGYIAGATAIAERAQSALVEIEKVHKMYHDLKGDNPAANHILNIAREYLQQWNERKEVVSVKEQVYPDKCTCRYPSFNPMTDRCLICNRLYNSPK